MKNILKYIGLLVVAVLISRASFAFIDKHPSVISILICVSVVLGFGIIFWTKIYSRYKNEKTTYLFFLLTNFTFALLMGTFYKTGPIYAGVVYFIALVVSTYQLSRLVNAISLHEKSTDKY